MTLQEIIDVVTQNGGSLDSEVILYIKSETYEPEVAISREDGRVYLFEK